MSTTSSETTAPPLMMPLPEARAAFLVGTWKTALENDIALGHLSPHTHPDRDVLRMIRVSRVFKVTYATCSILALSKKKDVTIYGTPKSQKGAAVAVVVSTDNSLDILHLVVNPNVENKDAIAAAVREIITEIHLTDPSKDLRFAETARAGFDAPDILLGVADPSEETIIPLTNNIQRDEDGLFEDQREIKSPLVALSKVSWIDLKNPYP